MKCTLACDDWTFSDDYVHTYIDGITLAIDLLIAYRRWHQNQSDVCHTDWRVLRHCRHRSSLYASIVSYINFSFWATECGDQQLNLCWLFCGSTDCCGQRSCVDFCLSVVCQRCFSRIDFCYCCHLYFLFGTKSFTSIWHCRLLHSVCFGIFRFSCF